MMALQTPVISQGALDENGNIIHITETQKDLYRIVFRMVCADDTTGYDGLDVTYPVKYRPGDGPGDKVDAAIEFFQGKIDSYEASKAIETHAGMATAIAAIQNGLVI